MKKRVIVFLAVCGICTAAQAQNIERFKGALQQPDSAYQSRVAVTEHGTAATTVRSLAVQPSGEKVRGFRVRIFVDNSQNARAKAQEALTRFNEIYPDIPAYMNYDNPYFKVTVGNCLSSEEAIILWGRIKDAFDRAFVMREEISLSVFGECPPSVETSKQ